MRDRLDEILNRIGEEYKEYISKGARNYLEIDLGEQAEKLGYSEETLKYKNINAVIPLKGPFKGMKVRIDGRTFVNYAQFDSGVAVPGYVASETGLPSKAFTPNDSMILNFA